MSGGLLWNAFPLRDPDLADETFTEVRQVPEDEPGDEGDDSQAERKEARG